MIYSTKEVDVITNLFIDALRRRKICILSEDSVRMFVFDKLYYNTRGHVGDRLVKYVWTRQYKEKLW